MKKFGKYGVLAALAFAVTPYANAGLIEGQLFNTGLNSSGGLISDTQTDDNWSWSRPSDGLTGGAVEYFNRAYAPNGNSQWVSVAGNGGNNDQAFRETVFSTTFDLTGYDASTAKITGWWGVDNSATISLNNDLTSIALAFGKPSFNALNSFTIGDGFVAGMNTLSVNLTNGYPDLTRTDIGPLALRFDMLELTATKVPEPGTLALLGLGLAGLGFARRRKL